ncbi:MAG: tryptophan synthase subunit alpha [Candidatus Omnitrophica bacterium]|nr:tryptophan synthase subunit alpha [Candidatus Omnitrophota bacterium]
MTSFDKKIEKIVSTGKKLFIPYLTFMDPDMDCFRAILQTLASKGADAIEIGIPFSDPASDGPTIQRASVRALKNGATLTKALSELKRIKSYIDIPIIFMSYYNPIFSMGDDQFLKVSRKNKLDGVVIPDLPIEESAAFIKKARIFDISCISLVAPTTNLVRMRKINRLSSGFIYYVSTAGVTGTRKKLSNNLSVKIKQAKRCLKKPLCVGFGISNPGQVRQIKKSADGVIVGSAIVSIIEKNLQLKNKTVLKIAKFAQEIMSALDE